MKSGDRAKRKAEDLARKPRPHQSELERRVLQHILDFPDRIDEMETRNEENCQQLAAQICRLVEEEFRRRNAGR